MWNKFKSLLKLNKKQENPRQNRPIYEEYKNHFKNRIKRPLITKTKEAKSYNKPFQNNKIEPIIEKGKIKITDKLTIWEFCRNRTFKKR
jgi:hypothetical protein